MNRIMVMALVSGLLCAMFSGVVKGDGMPITTVTVHKTLRENRQIALVDVGDDSNETISLFISITSLEPGNKATVLVPLKTAPNVVGLARTNDSHFEENHHIKVLSDLAKKADSALGDVSDSYHESVGTLAFLSVVPMGLYVMTSGYMTGGGGYFSQQIYVDDGLGATVASFGDVSSINETFAQLGIQVPDDAREMINEYGAYNAAIINVTTRPPIEEAKYNDFKSSYPRVLGSFKEYVAEHDSIDVSVAGFGKINANYFANGQYQYHYLNFLDEQLTTLLRQVRDPTYQEIFYLIVLATYGLLPSEGFELTANLPLDDGRAFFPLGTSPSWSGQGDVKVAFKIPDEKGLRFDRATVVITRDGSRYYLFDYGSTAPDYDLEAKVVGAGLTEWLIDKRMDIAFWTSDNSAALGFAAALATMWSIWLGVSVLFARKGHILKRDRRLLVPMMATGAMTATIFFSFLGGLFFCFILLALASKKPAINQISGEELRDIRIQRLADALCYREALRTHEVDDRSKRLVR